ncbi:hypothetical protein C8R44DRAFT_738242 [Mycena epipterygia]|nr:hypothetical protein C8R44DRAFT_738242 [Mycena epipterygia]
MAMLITYEREKAAANMNNVGQRHIKEAGRDRDPFCVGARPRGRRSTCSRISSATRASAAACSLLRTNSARTAARRAASFFSVATFWFSLSSAMRRRRGQRQFATFSPLFAFIERLAGCCRGLDWQQVAIKPALKWRVDGVATMMEGFCLILSCTEGNNLRHGETSMGINFSYLEGDCETVLGVGNNLKGLVPSKRRGYDETESAESRDVGNWETSQITGTGGPNIINRDLNVKEQYNRHTRQYWKRYGPGYFFAIEGVRIDKHHPFQVQFAVYNGREENLSRTVMGKRKRKLSAVVGDNNEITEEQTERNRQAYKRYYKSHPEIREKKRLQMAERRAAAKAAKRRWDPPKKKKVVPVEPEEADSNPDSPNFCGADVLNATNLRALSRIPNRLVAPNSVSGPRDAGRTPSCVINPTLILVNINVPVSNASSSAAAASRINATAAALEHLTHGQVWHQGISGSMGPLTGVQSLQILVAELNSSPIAGPTPAEANHWGDDHDPPEPPLLQTMGLERWNELYYWSEEVMLLDPPNEWDLPAQLAFVKAKKSIMTASNYHVYMMRRATRLGFKVSTRRLILTSC